MSGKQLLLLTLAMLLSIAIIISGLFLVYKFFPEYLGIAPKNKKVLNDDNSATNPIITLPKKQYDELQSKVLQSEILMLDKTQLVKSNKKLIDSITFLQTNISSVNNELKDNSDSLLFKGGKSRSLRDSLNRMNVSMNVLKNELKKITEAMDKLKSNNDIKADSIKNFNLQTFAKIYENSNPQDVARILEILDEKDASKILKLMTKKKAGKVIEALNPDKGAAIMMLGTDDDK